MGLELEWLTVDFADVRRPASPRRVCEVTEALGPLPGGSALTFEPGGQVELSSPPHPLGRACNVLARDAEVLGTALADAGVGLVALGLEPGPRRERSVRTPRYDAMESYFDTNGSAGRTMMRSTAALQVNLGFGDDADLHRQWRRAHDLGPVLAATFANSPFGTDGPSGHRSTRLATWSAIDRGRTAPADCGNGRGCREAWADYALSANVMLVQLPDGGAEAVLDSMAFADWLERGHRHGWPTVDDLDYHLTTLFPPVRPRGWLELRMIDALPAPWWRVAAGVAAVLVHDDAIAESVDLATAPARQRWREAARDGLAHPVLAVAARRVFSDALAAMTSAGADATTMDATAEFVERFVNRGRTLADERLDQWASTGTMLPSPDNAMATTTPEAAWG